MFFKSYTISETEPENENEETVTETEIETLFIGRFVGANNYSKNWKNLFLKTIQRFSFSKISKPRS